MDLAGKLTSTVNVGANALFFLLTPIAARLAGPAGIAACFAGLGLAQGPLIPARSVMMRDWLPQGPERAWAMRLMEMGIRVAPMISVATVPRMAAAYGWRSVPLAFGGVAAAFTVLWQLLAADGEESLTRRRELKQQKEAGGGKSTEAVVDWSIFSLPSVQVIATTCERGLLLGRAYSHTDDAAFCRSVSGRTSRLTTLSRRCSSGRRRTSRQCWAARPSTPAASSPSRAPTCPPLRLGRSQPRCGSNPAKLRTCCVVVVARPLTNNIGNFVLASVENVLLTRGVPLLTIRRSMTMVGSTIQAAFLLLFALAKSPIAATAAYAGERFGHCFRGSGAA